MKKLESKYATTPIYGIISKNKKRFSDCDLFKNDLWKYATLLKIKIWWGSPRTSENFPKIKTLLGIECKYKNIMTGEIKESKHCGILDSNDINIKEINLQPGDFFNQFNIGFENSISYIKFTTKNSKEIIEFGQPIKEEIKKVKVNMGDEPNMVQCFIGYYNDNRITALGCKYIKKKDYLFMFIMDIFRLRHFFKINPEEKEKWENNLKINKYTLYIKAIAKLCLLPDNQFNCIIKYCA